MSTFPRKQHAARDLPLVHRHDLTSFGLRDVGGSLLTTTDHRIT